MTVAVLGYGHVGKQVASLFGDQFAVLVYDPWLGFDDTQEAINNECEVCFIAVPTPAEPNSGFLDTVHVRSSLAWLEVPLIVIRSTINVGDTDKWARETGHTICYSPAWGPGETVGHLFADMKQSPFVIVAGSAYARGEAIEWYSQVYPASVRFIQMTAKDAEITKLWENCFAGTKVTFFNELAQVCHKLGADFNAVREALISDPRIGPWWTFAHGGWDSKCLSKDLPAAAANADGMAPLVESVIEINREHLEI